MFQGRCLVDIRQHNLSSKIEKETSYMTIIAKMPCVIETIEVNVGDAIEAGQKVGSVEAMKMSLPIVAEVAGIVKLVKAIGDRVDAGDIIVGIE